MVVDAIGRVDAGSSEGRMQCRGGRLVGLVVGTSLLAACTGGGGETEEAGPWPSSSASSESAAATSSSAATSAPAVPVMPEEARGEGDAAAVAFVEHWVELVNYALATGDTGPARDLAPDCSTCDAVLSDIESTFGQQEAGRWILLQTETFEPREEDTASTDVVVVGGISTDGSASRVGADLTFGAVSSESRSWVISWLDVRER
ncbi:DUF6318 family protein [Nocardioides zeae]|uniref:DUF6318 domain-containing protein n=1 Tax=Nocardioides zeae TaxID=1457234 RepID=A0AAJ1X0L7_9ACTN|nr:DUF6318 family protein [Nocardioides zeae]MDQ1103264.1 hypothetical protein [Nocardioides zeae]